jgi:hypothetical protein
MSCSHETLIRMAVFEVILAIMHTQVLQFLAATGVTSMAEWRFSNHVHWASLHTALSFPQSCRLIFFLPPSSPLLPSPSRRGYAHFRAVFFSSGILFFQHLQGLLSILSSTAVVFIPPRHEFIYHAGRRVHYIAWPSFFPPSIVGEMT